LIDKRRHPNILDVLSFRGANCDTDHYLVVAKLRERISVSKRARQNFDLERFDLKKLDDVEVKEKYQVETSNRFAGLENLDESFDINNAWESIRENIKNSAKDNLGQWYSTGGTRRHLRGYVKFKISIYVLFHE
jgi:hypothetical protein